MTKVTIERADNGYIIRHDGLDCEGETMEIVEVCEQAEPGCQCRALMGAVWAAIDALGMAGSKHDACRVNISCKCGKDG